MTVNQLKPEQLMYLETFDLTTREGIGRCKEAIMEYILGRSLRLVNGKGSELMILETEEVIHTVKDYVLLMDELNKREDNLEGR